MTNPPGRTLATILLTLLFMAACAQQRPHVPPPENVRTVEDTSAISAIPIEQPPTVRDESTLLRDTAPPPEGTTVAPVPLAPQAPVKKSDDAALAAKMELPFAPAIAMDPVDGGKVSIISSTPMAEYKGKLYYFTSEQNRRAFLSNPLEFLKGQLANY